MTWADTFLLIAVAGNLGGAVFTWHNALRLNRLLREATVLRLVLSNVAARQFETAAMASHGWRAWAGTMGGIHVRFIAHEPAEDENTM